MGPLRTRELNGCGGRETVYEADVFEAEAAPAGPAWGGLSRTAKHDVIGSLDEGGIGVELVGGGVTIRVYDQEDSPASIVSALAQYGLKVHSDDTEEVQGCGYTETRRIITMVA